MRDQRQAAAQVEYQKSHIQLAGLGADSFHRLGKPAGKAEGESHPPKEFKRQQFHLKPLLSSACASSVGVPVLRVFLKFCPRIQKTLSSGRQNAPGKMHRGFSHGFSRLLFDVALQHSEQFGQLPPTLHSTVRALYAVVDVRVN